MYFFINYTKMTTYITNKKHNYGKDCFIAITSASDPSLCKEDVISLIIWYLVLEAWLILQSDLVIYILDKTDIYIKFYEASLRRFSKAVISNTAAAIRAQENLNKFKYYNYF